MPWFIPALAVLMLMLLPGCTAKLTEYAQQSEIRDNRVGEITQAWRTPEGRLMVCANGWPYWRARNAEPVAFHFSVPLVRETGAARGSPHPGVDGVPVRRITVAEAAVINGCPEKPEDIAGIESAPVPTDRFGRLVPNKAGRQDVAMLADGEGALLWAVPVEGEPPRVAILYRHDEAVFRGSRLAWIDPGESEVYPNSAAALALPFAFVADAAAVVVILGTISLVAIAAAL